MRVYTIAEQIGTYNEHVLTVLRDDYGLDVRHGGSEVNDKLADCLLHSDSFKSLVLAAERQWDRAWALAHIYRLAGDAFNKNQKSVATVLYEVFWRCTDEYGISADETQAFASEANLGE